MVVLSVGESRLGGSNPEPGYNVRVRLSWTIEINPIKFEPILKLISFGSNSLTNQNKPILQLKLNGLIGIIWLMLVVRRKTISLLHSFLIFIQCEIRKVNGLDWQSKSTSLVKNNN